MDVLDRWKHFAEDVRYKEAFAINYDIVEMALEIFELPSNLKNFAASLKR
jgi:hypothetical protein